MAAIDGVESLQVIPNRFDTANFTSSEVSKVLGERAGRELSQDKFNLLAAYLVEEIGLYEEEVAEWFRSNAQGLEGRQPLSVWTTPEGFEKVFEYAKAYKTSVEEALEEE